VVHSVLTKSCGERTFKLVNISIMHVQNILLSLWRYLNRQLFRGYINRCQNSVVLLEESDGLVEHRASSDDTLNQPVVSLLWVFQLFLWHTFFTTVK